jgi:hypothetical protein
MRREESQRRGNIVKFPRIHVTIGDGKEFPRARTPDRHAPVAPLTLWKLEIENSLNQSGPRVVFKRNSKLKTENSNFAESQNFIGICGVPESRNSCHEIRVRNSSQPHLSFVKKR